MAIGKGAIGRLAIGKIEVPSEAPSGASATIGATTQGVVFAGTAKSGARAAIAATTAPSTFSGGGKSGALAQIIATTQDNASASIGARSGARAAISATTAAASFSGAAKTGSALATIAATTAAAVCSGAARSGSRAAIAATTANAIFAGSAGSYAPQLLAPVADISAGLWAPSSGSDLYAMVDEADSADADYIGTTSASSCELGIAPPEGAPIAGSRILRYRLLAGTGNLAVALRQGSTPIAAWGPHALTGAAQNFEQMLTTGQAAAITDYSDLRVVLTAS